MIQKYDAEKKGQNKHESFHFTAKSRKTEEEITSNRTSLFIMKMALNFHIWQNIFLVDFVMPFITALLNV